MKKNFEFLPVKIIASAIALPNLKVTSEQIDKKLNKSIGYCYKRSGIEYRYHADLQIQQSDLAAQAIANALNCHQIAPDSVDLLISASAIPVQALPYTASHILQASCLPQGIATLDINVSCVSFLAALNIAASLLNSNTYRRIVIVSADLASRGLDWQDEESSFIFGDGAACVVVEKGDGQSGIISYLLETYTDGINYCEIRAGGTRCNFHTGLENDDLLFHMQGKPLFKLASAIVEPFIERLLALADMSINDIATVIPHQASHLSLEHMRKRLNLSEETIINIYRYRGNQVAASIPSALHEAIITERFKADLPVMLIGTAAGLTLGGMILLP